MSVLFAICMSSLLLCSFLSLELGADLCEDRLNQERREPTNPVVALREAERQVRHTHAPYRAFTSVCSQRLLHKMINSRPFATSALHVR